MLDKLLGNAGAKLRTLAKVWFVIQLIGALIAAIAAAKMAEDLAVVAAVGVFVIMAFSAWISVLAVYAFAELCAGVKNISDTYDNR